MTHAPASLICRSARMLQAVPPAAWGWILLGLGLLVPLLGYVVLPALGIGKFTHLFSFNRLILMFGGIVGGVAYLWYLRHVLPRPQILVAFIVLAWPMVAYLNGLLLDVGVNIRLRPLLILAIALPSLYVTCRYGAMLWREIPWLKYYMIFFLWLVLYFFIYNANAVDPRLSGGEAASGEGSVSMVQLTAYFYCLMCISVSAVAGLKVRNFRGLFDALNKALILVSGFESLMTILGFPFGMFNLLLDGFTRATGIFSHPNPYAHHMGILMVYLLGLFCYYQGERRARMPMWLLLWGIGINFVAFLLGMSKTALAVFALCAGILFMMNLAVPAVRRGMLQIALAMLILVPLGLFGFQALSGESFFGLLESRIDDTTSLDWRTEVWGDLMAELNSGAVFLGNGFTSANATVFRLTFNDARNAQPLMMVHNAYIALLYDLGLMGYTMFLAVISMMGQAVRLWWGAVRPALRTEHSIILALAVYFLIVCGFDEMSYMFDAPMLFWVLATLLYCVNRREQQLAEQETAA